jgi:hypothetical protein
MSDEDRVRQGFEDAAALAGQTRARAWDLPGCPERDELLALAGKLEDILLKLAAERGWPFPRAVTFRAPSAPDRGLKLDLRVVQLLTGAGAEITPHQLARFREIEAGHGGTVPLTAEEYGALQDAKTARLIELARDPASNLHPLFCWDDKEAARLQRDRRMHGTGN